MGECNSPDDGLELVRITVSVQWAEERPYIHTCWDDGVAASPLLRPEQHDAFVANLLYSVGLVGIVQSRITLLIYSTSSGVLYCIVE